MDQVREWHVQFLDVNSEVKYQVSETCTGSKAVMLARKLEQMWRTRPASERPQYKKGKGKSVRSMRHL